MTIAKKNKNQCSDTSTTARIIFRSAMTFSSSFSPSSPLTEDNKTTANVNNNQTFLRSTAMVSTSPEVLSLLHGSKVNLVSHSIRNYNRKLWISRAPTKAKSQEPAYSQALNQNTIDRQRSRSRESGRLYRESGRLSRVYRA